MTALDSRLGPKALALILKYGKNATVRIENGVYTTADGSVARTPVEHIVKISPPQNFEITLENSNTVRIGDMKCLIAALNLAFTPVVGMKIIFDSQTWTCLQMTPYYSGELVVVWEFQLRK